MKNSWILIIFLYSSVYAHENHYFHSKPKKWSLNDGTDLYGFFSNIKNDDIWIELENGKLECFALTDFHYLDQKFFIQKKIQIEQLNRLRTQTKDCSFHTSSLRMLTMFGILGCVFFLLLFLAFFRKKWIDSFIGKMIGFAMLALILGSASKAFMGTDPLIIDAAFKAFKPFIKTSWDSKYFYVESQGIPKTHELMAGITSWQQQVPISQCYTGSNAWSIPLNPEIASQPVPVNPQHFIRGAIALAINGVPIFNPYTNTGVDALLDGQLDRFGGHSGRADDYHYHVAPLSLYEYTSDTLPIAYALDGFPVFGKKEPDGSNMLPLDLNHGHYWKNGVYHYHGTTEAPYMIGNMVGKVTEDGTLQIIPQAAAKPVRPSTTPLRGAVITKCIPHLSENGYDLHYSKDNQNYIVSYQWTVDGHYTYHFIGPNGSTTENYTGNKICLISNTVDDKTNAENIQILPNPASNELRLIWNQNIADSEVIIIKIFDCNGKEVYSQKGISERIQLGDLPAGVYNLVIYSKRYQKIYKTIMVN